MSNRTDQVLDSIDTKLDELEELLLELPIRPGAKTALVNKIYEFFEEVEDAVELQPVDFE